MAQSCNRIGDPIPVSSILALPPPSQATSSSGLPSLRKLLSSDALPVTAVRPVAPRDDQRRPESLRELEEAQERSVARTRSRSGDAGGSASSGSATDSPAREPVTATASPPSAGPVAGYVAQVIHQEVVGQGLHIEPWDAAIDAYRRADAGPSGGALVRSLTV